MNVVVGNRPRLLVSRLVEPPFCPCWKLLFTILWLSGRVYPLPLRAVRVTLPFAVCPPFLDIVLWLANVPAKKPTAVKKKGPSQDEDDGPGDNFRAKHALRRVEERLLGHYNTDLDAVASVRDGVDRKTASATAMALSVQGQVHRLIQQATSDENLSRMYVGWMPFL
jgi:hypothetical protein